MKHFLIFTAVLGLVYAGTLLFWKNRPDNDISSPFSRAHTQMLKGVGLACILWGHEGLAYNFSGIQWIAAVGVSVFLLLSGYGMAASWQRSGLERFWSKRLRKVLIPYLAVFGILSVLQGDPLRTTLEYLSVVKGHWYIAYLFGCYLLFWFAAQLSGGEERRLIRLLFVLFALWLVIDTLWFVPDKVPALRSRQMFAFPSGVLMALRRKDILKRLDSGLWALLLPLGLAVTALCQLSVIKNAPVPVGNALSLMTVVPLALFILWLSVKLPKAFDSTLLSWLGEISYEAFLLQHFLFHMIRRGVPWTLYAALAVVCLLAWVLHEGIKRIPFLQ